MGAPLMLSRDFKTIAVHGHRGARSLWPENTLPAFEYAIAAGVDAIELDLAVTKDRVVVVSHDPQLHPPICSGPKTESVIYTLTLAEVRQWDCGNLRNPEFPRQQTVPGTPVPTLDEVFALAPEGNFLFNLETKIFPDHPELAPSPEEFVMLVLERIRKHGLESRVILQSFDFRALRIMQGLAPEIALSALYEGAPRVLTDIAHEAGTGIVAPQFNLVTQEQVRTAHAAGLQVMTWTPNTPQAWDRLIAAGVDAIITDDPAALLAHLKKNS
jgi:glycerophosphoryl diester phosphodiesterase